MGGQEERKCCKEYIHQMFFKIDKRKKQCQHAELRSRVFLAQLVNYFKSCHTQIELNLCGQTLMTSNEKLHEIHEIAMMFYHNI